MLSPNLWRSEGRRPSHITLGTVRLWASNDMACGKTIVHTNIYTRPVTKTNTHTHTRCLYSEYFSNKHTDNKHSDYHNVVMPNKFRMTLINTRLFTQDQQRHCYTIT